MNELERENPLSILLKTETALSAAVTDQRENRFRRLLFGSVKLPLRFLNCFCECSMERQSEMGTLVTGGFIS